MTAQATSSARHADDGLTCASDDDVLVVLGILAALAEWESGLGESRGRAEAKLAMQSH